MNVKLKTTMGDVLITLNSEKAPKTVENFLQYVRDGHYDGTIFHRVIDGFMIQGGGFESGMSEKPTREPVENEADNGLANNTGTIAMARTQDPHSASAQFFISTQDNDFLNHKAKNTAGWGYCVFGEVTEGSDVVTRIEEVATCSRAGHQDVPSEDVIIDKAEIIE